uniref:THAP-type domain-containing protein n=1 Tax=Neogobius melanostomus TaxID=47308 RepID=A0A8C6T966_9GOBI
MRREDWAPSRFSVLCIRHFDEQHLDRTGKSVTLKEDAVPTIFTSPAEGDDVREQSTIQVRTLQNVKNLEVDISIYQSIYLGILQYRLSADLAPIKADISGTERDRDVTALGRVKSGR